ncbi:MAG TPA: phosphoribosylanthranilate isomerase [Gemmatimonadaceae bacterium]|nr:phosphoribosylanthranilate isomerase [Gemmatimonadaceae bacterium]
MTGSVRGALHTAACAPRVKVCCIASIDEAHLAIAHGASALGLVSRMPSGPGPIDESLIAEIIATVPPPIATFLLTSATGAVAILDQQHRLRPTTLQLVDHVETALHHELRRALPGISLVQVVHVEDDESVDYALSVAPGVDALLLDSGRLKAAVRELGGTGRTHDWQLSRRIRDTAARPVFLAGGLRADNVADAIRTVAPFALDLCTGVRTDSALDPSKLAAFMSAVHSA